MSEQRTEKIAMWVVTGVAVLQFFVTLVLAPLSYWAFSTIISQADRLARIETKLEALSRQIDRDITSN